MISFVVGLTIGVWFGVVLMGALFVASENDRKEEKK